MWFQYFEKTYPYVPGSIYFQVFHFSSNVAEREEEYMPGYDLT